MLAIALTGTSVILATSASTSSVSKVESNPVNAAFTSTIEERYVPSPTFRFDDTDAVASNDLQSAAQHSAKQNSQALESQPIINLWPVPDPQQDALPLALIDTQPATAETIVERFENTADQANDDNNAATETPVEKLVEQQTVPNETVEEELQTAHTTLAKPSHAQVISPTTTVNTRDQIKAEIITVKAGDTLSGILAETQISDEHRNEILSNELVKDHLTQLHIGTQFHLQMDADGQLQSLRVKASRDTRMHIESPGAGVLKIAAEHLPIKRERVVTTGEIDQSLYLAAEKANLKQSTIMALSDIFEWELDFARDIRKGDHFSIVYDRLFRDGEYIGDGDILAAEFVQGERRHTAVRFTDDDGHTDYYSSDGHSKRRAFMRHPVDVVRITSRFDPNRLHPVLHKIRAHNGVDYGAPYGSPIYATADGTIDYAGSRSTYGKTVILKHGEQRSTLYAHMSNIAKGTKTGKRVKRGDAIGYVGKSGRVTGTHLHYEFRISGKHVDPLTVELPGAPPLAKKYLAKLKASSQELFAQMHSFTPTNDSQLALNK